MNPSSGTDLSTILAQGNQLAAAWYGSISGNPNVLPSVVAATGGNVGAAQQAVGISSPINVNFLLVAGLIIAAIIVVAALTR